MTALPPTVDATRLRASWLWVTFNRARYRLGVWILGDGLLGYLSWQTLVVQMTREAIREDGRVDLTDCKAVAGVLYGVVPGDWSLTLTKHKPPTNAVGGVL